MGILFHNKQIETRVESLALEASYKNNPNNEPIVMICVLNGAFMFFTDLVKRLKVNVEIDFLRAKTYEGTKAGEVQILKDIELDLSGKNVYIVDDIYDSGKTMDTLMKHIQTKNPASVTPLVLFKKISSNRDDLMWGFELENEYWIHGYGLDDEKGLSRNLKHVYGERVEID